MSDVLRVEDLCVDFGTGHGRVRAVDSVNLVVPRGAIVGLVGESGSGKSTVARTIVGMQAASSGRIFIGDTDVLAKHRVSRRERAERVQMIFQDPYSSLNPRMRVGESIDEVLATYGGLSSAQRRDSVAELLQLVTLSPETAALFPQQISGGMRQRVAIARCLAARPRLIVADEITSALDVSVQGVILNLLRDLQNKLELSVLFISHNLAAVRYISESIAVMQRGRIVEFGTADDISLRPSHPYTRALIDALPRLDDAGRDVLLSRPS